MIAVIGDDLTKLSYFLPWKETATIEELAYVYIRNIVAQHGTLDVIKLDRGSMFTSQF